MQRHPSSTAQPASPRPTSAPVRPVIEPLESRQLLSAVVPHASPAIDSGLSITDLKFLQQTDSTLELEIQLGAFAASQGSDTLITAFGSRVVTYETPVLAQLDTLASTFGITLSNSLSPSGQAIAGRLTRFTGAGFDPLYAQQTVKDHQLLIKTFERESAKTPISAIQNFINSALPVIQTDQEFAIQARDTVKPQIGAGIRLSTPKVATPTSYSASGVFQVGIGSTSTTTKKAAPPPTSAAGQVGVGTQNLVGVGTANDGTGIQRVVVTSNV